jgi:hypothetical protein
VASLEIDGDELLVTLARNERWWGLLSDVRVALSAIVNVEVVPDGRRAVRGIRAPGLGGRNRLIGTWRAKDDKQYVCVRRDQPAVKATLVGQRYRTLLVGVDDADHGATTLRVAANL